MTDDQRLKMGKTPGQFTGTGSKPQGKAGEDDFPGDFAKLKLSVIRPTFESIGNGLKERGHEFNISEEPGGKISIHIVPAGVSKSIHPYDWFPTFSIFGAPFTKSIGLHGRNAKRNSDGGFPAAVWLRYLPATAITVGRIAPARPAPAPCDLSPAADRAASELMSKTSLSASRSSSASVMALLNSPSILLLA
jgi:hypothetical protein